MKGNKSVGSGLTVQTIQNTVHGNELKDNEVALIVESLKVKSLKHEKYGYNIEVGGFTARNVDDIEVLS